MTRAKLPPELLEQVAYRFRLLGDPMRLRLLHELQGGEQTVGDLVRLTGSSQPNVSKHLSILRNAGIVKRRQESNQAWFSVSTPVIFELCDIVCTSITDELNEMQKTLVQPVPES